MSASARRRGFSLVEMSLTLAVLGVIAVALLAFLVRAQREGDAHERADTQARAERAVVAFVRSHGRLPRPAADPDGVEVPLSDPRSKGYLPWRTLGLPVPASGRLQYAAYRGSAGTGDLTRLRDRFRPLWIDATGRLRDGDPLPGPGAANLVDTCYELHRLGRQTAGAVTNALRMRDAAGQSNIAYAIVAPGPGDADGDGGVYDGHQGNLGTAVVNWAGAPATARFDDRVVAARFEALAAELACGEALALIGHAHFNAALSARLLDGGWDGYEDLADLEVRRALAQRKFAIGEQATAAANTVLVSGSLATGIAQGFKSFFTNLDEIISAGIGLTVAAPTVNTLARLGRDAADDGVAGARRARDTVARDRARVPFSTNAIERNARAGDAQGF